ncbi:MAG: hypothetical protein KIT84_35815 [Labilithrix sp.]|nr:hypothetical protein [Labilithrix sp.]MCW5816421.1 hypothetical protein [Labilithrix sp.]
MRGATSNIDRRTLLLGLAGGLALTALGCSDDEDAATSELALERGDAGDTGSGDAGALVVLYDTYAQALYLDGTLGPKTGIVRATDMGVGEDKVYDFWHGHEGRLHRFTVTAAHFARLRQKQRVTIATTVVSDHQHTLFIDPVDLRWRVPGAPPVSVPV